MSGPAVNDNLQSGFCIGDWEVYPQENLLKGHDSERILEPKVMDVLVFLAASQGVVASRRKILDSVWAGVVVGDETLSRAISVLRTELGDDQKNPQYLKTISKRGYCFIADVTPIASPRLHKADPAADAPESSTPEYPSESITSPTRRVLRAAGIVLSVAAILYLILDRYVLQDAAYELAPRKIGKSIAVLPFRNRSAIEEDAFFADGIHDDILMHLVKLSSLDRVISRTSMEQYRETSKSMPQIGEELAVATILEGGIQRAGDRVRINVQLIDAASDEHLWAESYDRALTVENLFAIQSEISREIARSLQLALTETEKERLNTVPTISLEAYREFVLGHEEMEKRTPDALRRATLHFEKAIELDPEYALAYVGLADSLAYRISYADLTKQQAKDRRRAAIDRALILEPLSGEAYVSLAMLRWSESSFEDAEPLFLKALELNPNYSHAHRSYATALSATDRYEQALQHNLKAVELDPKTAINHTTVARSLWSLGRIEEARAIVRNNTEQHPHFPDNYLVMSQMLIAQGRLGEAMHWIHVAQERIPRTRELMTTECWLHLQLDAWESAERCYESVAHVFPERGTNWIVSLHRFRAQYQAAVDMFEQVEREYPYSRIRQRLAMDYLNNGEPEKARRLLRLVAPQLYSGDVTGIEPTDVRKSVLIAYTEYVDGEIGRANFLFDLALDTMRSENRTGAAGYQTWDVFIHAARDDKQRAILALREAIDTGWRQNWWWLRFPVYDAMREEPEWVSLVRELENDIARQRQWFEDHKDDPLF